MAMQTLYTAATGMEAMQTKLDTISNNLANVSTTAFKRDRANFEDLFYINYTLPGAEDSDGNLTPTGVYVGLGTRVSGTQTEFRQGSLDTTNKELDWAIEGKGFFQVLEPGTGEILYTRAGTFDLNNNGQVVMASAGIGRLLEPPVVIPQDATHIEVSPQGVVSVKQPGNPQLQPLGTLQLAQFVNPDGLVKLGDNLYAESNASGPPQLGNPGQDGIGMVRQGVLEQSNVEPVRELIDLITTQRSFELNSQAVQAGDQVLQLVANLRRF